MLAMTVHKYITAQSRFIIGIHDIDAIGSFQKICQAIHTIIGRMYNMNTNIKIVSIIITVF